MKYQYDTVILFHTTHSVMWARKLLKNTRIEHALVAVPRNFSSDCGYCLNISSDNTDVVMKIITDAGIEYDRIEKIIK